jgi:hypothetical protein
VKAEVPPVDTLATGMAQFQFSSDGKEINYDKCYELKRFYDGSYPPR